MVSGLVQWIATSPRWLVQINWDAGSYLHQIAAGNLVWSSPTWTAHAALQYFYLIACALARLVHATPADGFRLLNAVCFAICVVAIVHVGVKVTHSRRWAVLCAALWATAFVTQFLTFTLEDNIVFLTPAVLLGGLCALRCDRWGSIESLLAGLLAAAALALSIQGAIYLFPPLFLAAFVPRRGATPGRRTLDSALVVLGFCVGLTCFVLFFLASSSLTWRQSLAHLFARPTSTFPQSKAALAVQLFDVKAALRTVGIATSLHIFQNHRPWTSAAALVDLGAATMTVQAALVVVTALRARRSGHFAAFFFAVMLFGMTVLTALYRDVEYAYLKRTDFVPMVLVFLVMSVVGATDLSVRGRRLFGALLGILLMWQVITGLRWRGHEVSTYETLDATVLGRSTPGYHGLPPEGSFLRHFRSLRQANRSACRFIFDLSDVQHGRWNPDLSGVIWSELPHHAVLISPQAMRAWPRPLVAWDPGQAKAALVGCEWLSDAAQSRLGLVAAPAW